MLGNVMHYLFDACMVCVGACQFLEFDIVVGLWVPLPVIGSDVVLVSLLLANN